MPLINSSTFKPSIFCRNSFLQTIIPNSFRKVNFIFQERKRIYTKDKDFLDLDFSFSRKNNSHLIILTHGTEGFSTRTYIKGMAKIFIENGWDVLAWNFRGCSGETNNKECSYTGDKYQDLQEVVHYALKNYPYKEIGFIGFSLGANLIIKYF